jgi:DNA (cytosine-5)-methyltransferase 1
MPARPNVLSLFSGIGGLELGLERAGMTTIGQVEIDPFARAVLARHWPDVPRHDDVRTAVEWWRGEPRPAVDLIAGGFPCQGHSLAGKRRGTGDERWGWPWFRDVVEALGPRVILIENVPNLTRTGLVDVLEDLAGLGFAAEWSRVPAAAMGAPHLRWRLFIIAAHAERIKLRDEPGWRRGADREGPTVTGFDGSTWALADAHGGTLESRRRRGRTARGGVGAHALADAGREGRRSGRGECRVESEQPTGEPGRTWAEPVGRGGWPAESDVGRVAYGVPGRVDRLRTLGNAVVPAVAEYVGRLIIDGFDWGPDG